MQGAAMALDAVLGTAYLTANTVLDLRSREISVPVSALYAGIVLILRIARDGAAPLQLAAGLLPGAVLCLLSLIGKEKVGAGDGIAVMALGLAMGFDGAFSVFFLGCLLAGAWSLLGMAAGKCRVTDSIPFMPFLLGAYLLRLAQTFAA